MNYLIVFIGAGLGGMARHAINVTAFRTLGSSSFPFGTLTINVLGSFLMGSPSSISHSAADYPSMRACFSRQASSAGSPPSRRSRLRQHF